MLIPQVLREVTTVRALHAIRAFLAAIQHNPDDRSPYDAFNTYPVSHTSSAGADADR
jgi:hypothetical protein